MAEKLIRVNSHSELRPGMLVVLKACKAVDSNCGLDHQFMLLRQIHDRFSGCQYLWTHTPPTPECRLAEDEVILDFAIPEGRLFRIDDGLEFGINTTKQLETVE